MKSLPNPPNSRVRPASPSHLSSLSRAIDHLEVARVYAIKADRPRLTAKIRSALKSAGGAARHMERRMRATSNA